MSKLIIWGAIIALLLSLPMAALMQVIYYPFIFALLAAVSTFISVVYLLTCLDEKKKTTKIPKIKKWPQLSVVVPAYNCENTITRCLSSVLSMNYPRKFEVIVVADAISDKIAKKRQGKARAMNKGVSLAKGNAIALIDSDTFPSKTALENTVPFLEDKTTGAVFAFISVEKSNNPLKEVQRVEYNAASGFWHHALGKMESIFVTPGPMVVYRKKTLDRLGGFEEGNLTEDMEMTMRMQDKGLKVVFNPRTHVYTDVPETLPKLYRQRLRWTRGKIYNGLKYKHMFFNSFFGELGRFVLPASFLVDLLGMLIVFGLIVWNLSAFSSLMGGIPSILATEPSLLLNPDTYSHQIGNPAPFLITTAFILTFTILWFSFETAGQKFKLSDVPAGLLFTFLYPFFIVFIGFSSLAHEASRSEYKW
ncbi:MAG: glycosyltransferase [Candidatus Micrarchaeia archaeon]